MKVDEGRAITRDSAFPSKTYRTSTLRNGAVAATP